MPDYVGAYNVRQVHRRRCRQWFDLGASMITTPLCKPTQTWQPHLDTGAGLREHPPTTAEYRGLVSEGDEAPKRGKHDADAVTNAK